MPSQQECITKGGSITELPRVPTGSPGAAQSPVTQATLPSAAPYSGQ